MLAIKINERENSKKAFEEQRLRIVSQISAPVMFENFPLSKHCGMTDWRIIYTHSAPQQWRKLRNQLHAQASLTPGRESSDWFSDPVWIQQC